MMLMIEALRRVIKRMHYPLEVMLICVRWYAAYPLSLRHIEEMMAERDVFVDHATVHRWSIKILPVLAVVFRRCKHPVGMSWRMDETYIKVCGEWKYLYRAVDRAGDTIDFSLRAHRDVAAARSSSKAPSTCTACLRRPPSTGAPPTPPPSRAFVTTLASTSSCVNRSISTTSSSRTTGRSSASCDPCSASRRFAAREP